MFASPKLRSCGLNSWCTCSPVPGAVLETQCNLFGVVGGAGGIVGSQQVCGGNGWKGWVWQDERGLVGLLGRGLVGPWDGEWGGGVCLGVGGLGS